MMFIIIIIIIMSVRLLWQFQLAKCNIEGLESKSHCLFSLQNAPFHIPQRGVEWKQGVVIYIMLYTSLLYNTTPIHFTPDPLHPPLQSIQKCPLKVQLSQGPGPVF